jgi:translation elongation factor EF-Tu-like GTPase
MKAKFGLEDIFNVTGRGVVLTGRIIEGNFNKNDLIVMGDKLISIKAIEMFRKLMDGAEAGDNVGILIGNQMTVDEARLFRKQDLDITDRSGIRQDKLDQLGI